VSTQAPWAVPSARTKYKIPTDAPTPADSSPMASISGPGLTAANSLNPLHPDSPLFWFAGAVALTFGLMAVSGRGSIRLGPLRANAGASLADPDKKE
jgi:hypothetical protein